MQVFLLGTRGSCRDRRPQYVPLWEDIQKKTNKKKHKLPLHSAAGQGPHHIKVPVIQNRRYVHLEDKEVRFPKTPEELHSTMSDIILISRTVNNRMDFVGLAFEAAWLLGLWVGDGFSVSARFATHAEETGFHKRIGDVANLFDQEVTMTLKEPVKGTLGTIHILRSREVLGNGVRRYINGKTPFWDLVTFFKMNGTCNKRRS